MPRRNLPTAGRVFGERRVRGSDELRYAIGVFNPRRTFNTRCDVDGIRANSGNCIGDIIWSEAASEH